MNLKFEDWLSGQQNRGDHIGDFARLLSEVDLPQKKSRQKWDEHKGWTDIVVRRIAPDYIPVFNLAWQEFLLAKADVNSFQD